MKLQDVIKVLQTMAEQAGMEYRDFLEWLGEANDNDWLIPWEE